MIEEFGEDSFNSRKVSVSETLKRFADLMYDDADADEEDSVSLQQSPPNGVSAELVKRMHAPGIHITKTSSSERSLKSPNQIYPKHLSLWLDP